MFVLSFASLKATTHIGRPIVADEPTNLDKLEGNVLERQKGAKQDNFAGQEAPLHDPP